MPYYSLRYKYFQKDNQHCTTKGINKSIKTMDYVSGVQWSEMVEVIGDNNSEVISAFFNNHKQSVYTAYLPL
jgi:hypothetical protein